MVARQPITSDVPEVAEQLTHHAQGAFAVVDREVVVHMDAWLVDDVAGRLLDVPQLLDGHGQWRLVRLVRRAERVVVTGRPSHLDMAAQYGAHRPGGGDLHQGIEAVAERAVRR